MSPVHGSDLGQKIIQVLREQPGTYVSGHHICKRIGISRTLLWKQMSLLREAGHPISARPRRGYAWVTQASPLARTTVIGRRVLHFMKTSSTNDVARQLLREEQAVEGTVVIADEQTVGRGRFDRSWVSPRGGLWLSVVLRPPTERFRNCGLLGMLAAVAVAEAVRTVTGLNAVLKWPNDIIVDGHKVGGILSEMCGDKDSPAVIIGIGVNVNFDSSELPPEVMFRAATLKSILGRNVQSSKLLSTMLERMELHYLDFAASGPASILQQWRELNCTLGFRVTISTPRSIIVGTAVDVDDDGSLVVETSDGQHMTLSAGDVLRQDPGRKGLEL